MPIVDIPVSSADFAVYTPGIGTLSSRSPIFWGEFHGLSAATVVSRYYDTAGIRKKYRNIQTIEISSINF